MPNAFLSGLILYVYNYREQREVKAVTYVSSVEELAKVKLSRYRLEKSVSRVLVIIVL